MVVVQRRRNLQLRDKQLARRRLRPESARLLRLRAISLLLRRRSPRRSRRLLLLRRRRSLQQRRRPSQQLRRRRSPRRRKRLRLLRRKRRLLLQRRRPNLPQKRRRSLQQRRRKRRQPRPDKGFYRLAAWLMRQSSPSDDSGQLHDSFREETADLVSSDPQRSNTLCLEAECIPPLKVLIVHRCSTCTASSLWPLFAANAAWMRLAKHSIRYVGPHFWH